MKSRFNRERQRERCYPALLYVRRWVLVAHEKCNSCLSSIVDLKASLAAALAAFDDSTKR